MRILKDMMRFVAESRVLFKSVVAEGSERRFTDVLATRLIEIVDLVPRLSLRQFSNIPLIPINLPL